MRIDSWFDGGCGGCHLLGAWGAFPIGRTQQSQFGDDSRALADSRALTDFQAGIATAYVFCAVRRQFRGYSGAGLDRRPDAAMRLACGASCVRYGADGSSGLG